MRRGWRPKGTAAALPDESERAEDGRFLLSVYRVQSGVTRWEWTARRSSLSPPLALGEAETEDEAQRQAEYWTLRTRASGIASDIRRWARH